MYTARVRTHPNWLGLAPTRSSRTSTLSRPLISPLHALSPDGYRRRRRRFRPSPSPSCAAAHRHVLATVSFTESPAPPCRSVPARAPAANPSRHGAPARLPRLWLLSPRSLHRLHVSSACAVVRLGSPPTPTRLPCGYPCASVSVCVAARSALDGAVVPPHALWCGGGAPAASLAVAPACSRADAGLAVVQRWRRPQPPVPPCTVERLVGSGTLASSTSSAPPPRDGGELTAPQPRRPWPLLLRLWRS